jgi:hypothetical protein
MALFTLGGSIWGQEERDYYARNRRVDWGAVNTAPYDNTTYTYYGHQATNWNDKPIDERIKILTGARKGQSLMGRYKIPPYAPYPTKYNYADRIFKQKMDAIEGAGQFLDIPWTDYTGITHTIKLKED